MLNTRVMLNTHTSKYKAHLPSSQVEPVKDVMSQSHVYEFHSWTQEPPFLQDVPEHLLVGPKSTKTRGLSHLST